MTGKTVLVLLIMFMSLAVVPAGLSLAILALFERIGWRRGGLRVAVACLLAAVAVVECAELIVGRAPQSLQNQAGLMVVAMTIAVLACFPTVLLARYRRRRRDAGNGLGDVFS